jgi:hypothetical protein
MDEVFSVHFWHHHGSLILGTPWVVVVPLILIACFIGWALWRITRKSDA